MKLGFIAAIAVFCCALHAVADPADDLVRAEMSRHPIPGLALEIIQQGKPVKIAGYGLANLEWQTPVTPQTVF